MALPGSGLRWALSVSPCQVSPPWGMEAPQVATWQSFQFTSIFGLSREAGSPCGLAAGHMDQAKSQWAAGEVAAMTSFRSTILLSRNQTCPSSSSPASGVFSQLLSRTRKDRACAQHYHDSHRNSYYHRIKGKGEDFSGATWAEETNPTLPSTVPGGYRNPLVSALGVQPAEAWCSNQGSLGPRCRDWGGGVALETEDLCPRFSPGDCVSSPHPHGSGSCTWRPPVCSLPAV